MQQEHQQWWKVCTDIHVSTPEVYKSVPVCCELKKKISPPMWARERGWGKHLEGEMLPLLAWRQCLIISNTFKPRKDVSYRNCCWMFLMRFAARILLISCTTSSLLWVISSCLTSKTWWKQSPKYTSQPITRNSAKTGCFPFLSWRA